MAISYHIYTNNGQGGLVDYDTPIATTTELTWTSDALGFPSDSTFGVRAFDATSGIEEANTDARVRLVLDVSGNDVTARPNAILGLSATATSGGTCWVTWGYDPSAQGGPPSEFVVSLTAGSDPSTTMTAATVSYQAEVSGYGRTLSGLVGNTSYTIGVQAIGASSDLAGPVVTVGLIYRVASLSVVDSLVALPSP